MIFCYSNPKRSRQEYNVIHSTHISYRNTIKWHFVKGTTEFNIFHLVNQILLSIYYVLGNMLCLGILINLSTCPRTVHILMRQTLNTTPPVPCPTQSLFLSNSHTNNNFTFWKEIIEGKHKASCEYTRMTWFLLGINTGWKYHFSSK